MKKDGSLNAAYGAAQQRDSSKPGELKATFSCSAFQWVPTLWADYFVLLLEDNYAWATIGDPNRKHFWIIAREPTLPKLIFDMLRHHARVLGYDTDRLIISGGIV
ncbi:hypothetical protein AAVH_20644 [Aphelenchoides avenae]|nr:hypothetical protein AAVH_20644 [Aphelenchus avenae]